MLKKLIISTQEFNIIASKIKYKYIYVKIDCSHHVQDILLLNTIMISVHYLLIIFN